jgi:hypothetical protein
MAESQTGVEVPVRRRSLVKKVRLPRLSGKASAAWLVVCFGLTAALIPMALRLPRWVAFEIVVAVWWGIWLGVLTLILYKGHRVADDHQLHEPRMWFSWEKPKPQRDADSAWWDGFFWGWLWADDAILIVIGLFVLLGAAWLLIEIAIPVILFLLYFVARGMLAQVVNTRSHCAGRLGRALACAFLWATVYTAPLAAAVWFVHYVHQHSRHVV